MYAVSYVLLNSTIHSFRSFIDLNWSIYWHTRHRVTELHINCYGTKLCKNAIIKPLVFEIITHGLFPPAHPKLQININYAFLKCTEPTNDIEQPSN